MILTAPAGQLKFWYIKAVWDYKLGLKTGIEAVKLNF